jgi:hypothetical protein
MRFEIPTGETFRVSAKDLASLKPGNWYIGFRCRSCEEWFAIFDDKSKGTMNYAEVIEGEGRLRTTCPHCGDTHEYLMSQSQQKQV